MSDLFHIPAKKRSFPMPVVFRNHRKDIEDCIEISRSNPVQLSEHYHSNDCFSDDDDAQRGFVHPALLALMEEVCRRTGVQSLF